MSAPGERGDCLNCGAPLGDARYCPRCGQQAREPVPSVRGLFHQYFDDVLSLDSRILRTLRLLFLRPGILTREYLEGRRVRYVRPLRLYLVSSLFFFLVLGWTSDELLVRTSGLEEAQETSQAEAASDSTGADFSALEEVPVVGGFLAGRAERLASMEEERRNRALSEAVKRNLPKGVFALLPFFALALKLVYVRRQRGYVEHFVFALHAHSFAFLAFPIAILTEPDWLDRIIVLAIAVYILLAMRRVYAQGIGRTLVKFALLSMSYGVLLVLAMAITALVSALTI